MTSLAALALALVGLAACSDHAPSDASADGGMGGSSGGAAAAGGAGGGAGSAGTGGSAGGPRRCNGHAELCDRRFDQVAYAATHNSMSNADDAWLAPNQYHGLEQQLTDGIRSMLLDTHYDEGTPSLCHSACSYGKRELTDGLSAVKSFMDQNPNEVLSFLIEDYVSAEDTLISFTDSGLLQYVYTHTAGAAWPTLGEMIDSGARLVVMAQSGAPPPAWYHNLWDLAWDTPYSFESAEEFSCAENRGSRSNDLFLLNHWIERPLPSPAASEIANDYATLLGRARACQTDSGKLPNFVAVNHYSIGAVLQVVDELNGVASD